MTKFEELMDIIARKKNKGKGHDNIPSTDSGEEELEVSGSESTRAPLVATADDQLEPDLIDTLYTKPGHVPNRGEGASAWDSDY